MFIPPWRRDPRDRGRSTAAAPASAAPTALSPHSASQRWTALFLAFLIAVVSVVTSTAFAAQSAQAATTTGCVVPGSWTMTDGWRENPTTGAHANTDDAANGAVLSGQLTDMRSPGATFDFGLTWQQGGNFASSKRADLVIAYDGVTYATVTTPGPNSAIQNAFWTASNGATLSPSYGDQVNGMEARTEYPLSITLPGTVAPSGPLTMTMTVTSADGGSTYSDDFIVSGPDACTADLSIAKTAKPVVASGGTVSWNLAVTNNGPNTSPVYTVADAIPAGVTNITTPTAGCVVKGSDLSCAGGALAVGATNTITVSGTAPTRGASLTNTATVTGSYADPESSNNSSTASTVFAGEACAMPATGWALGSGWAAIPGGFTNQSNTANGYVLSKPLANMQTPDARIDFDLSWGQGSLSVNSTSAELTISYDGVVYATAKTPGALSTTQRAFWTASNGAILSPEFADWQTGMDPLTTYPLSITLPNTITDSGLLAFAMTMNSDQGSNPSGDDFTVTNLAATNCASDLSIVKTATAPTAQAGGPISWNIDVTNHGPFASPSYTVTDAIPAGVTDVTTTTAGCAVSGASVVCDGTKLAVGAVTTIAVTGKAPSTGTSLSNTATVVGAYLDPAATNNTSTATVALVQPTITVSKTVDSRVKPADQFVVTLTNAASSTLATATTAGTATSATSAAAPAELGGVYTITDAMAPGSSSALSSYSPTILCTDTTTGAAVATSGSAPTWTFVPTTVHAYECAVTNTGLFPSLSLTKTASPSTTADFAVGTVVTYTFEVENTGNAVVSGIAIDESGFGGAEILSPVSCTAGVDSLVPGAKATCTATYALTQADIDRGSLSNTATATGTAPNGDSIASSPSTATLTGVSAPKLTFQKTADTSALGDPVRAGDVVTYHFSATNSGNVTLTDVGFDDALAGLSALGYSWPTATAGTLAPGQTATATATYELTQTDLDAGSVTNTATVTGGAPNGGSTTTDSAVSIPLVSTASLGLEKTGGLASGATGKAGDTVEYTFTVSNTGNTTVTDVSVADALPGLSEISYGEWPGAAGTLTPGQSVTATATYELTQADVDAGSVVNTASAGAENPKGQPAAPGADTSTVEIASAPALNLVKTGGLAKGANGEAGDTVEFDFTATNTGNTTLTDVVITDALPGLSPIVYGPWPSGVEGALAPGQSVTASARYTLTQADLDTGSVVNAATVAGGNPDGTPVQGEGTVVVPLQQNPGLSLVKTGGLAEGAVAQAGEQLLFGFVLTNTGNTTLTDVGITDELPGLSAIVYGEWPSGVEGMLAPGESVTASASSTVTQADMDAGSVVNTAIGHATGAGKTPIDGGSQVTVPLAAQPGLTFVKTGALAAGTTPKVGSTVNFTFVVTNTGNVALTGVRVTDTMAGLSPIVYGDWPSGDYGTLAPGQSVIATAHYILTKQDVTAGTVTNIASVTATTPGGEPLTISSNSVSIPVHQAQSGDGGTLAHTGSDLFAPLGIAALLLALGATLLATIRIRRKKSA